MNGTQMTKYFDLGLWPKCWVVRTIVNIGTELNFHFMQRWKGDMTLVWSCADKTFDYCCNYSSNRPRMIEMIVNDLCKLAVHVSLITHFAGFAEIFIQDPHILSFEGRINGCLAATLGLTPLGFLVSIMLKPLLKGRSWNVL